jgi:hypothetical protein
MIVVMVIVMSSFEVARSIAIESSKYNEIDLGNQMGVIDWSVRTTTGADIEYVQKW